MAREICISEGIASKYCIPRVNIIKVRVGGKIVESHLKVKDNLSGYRVSSSLANEMRLRGKKLRLRYDNEENMIHLGPVIGILSTSLPNRANLEELDPTSLQAELTYLSHIGRTISGMVYVFLPGSVNWSSKSVKGYNYRFSSTNRGVWESALYPFPDVVYNRISSRRKEIRNDVQSTLQRLNEMPYTKIFNPSYLNKWQVYQTLSQNVFLRPYLPETFKLSEESLEETLKKYSVLYLKPSNGSLGFGIIKVYKLADDNLKFTVFSRSRLNGSSNNAAQIMKKTSVYRKDKPYIVQQGLDLARYHGSVFDIRIIYQKNGRGEWQIGKKFARIAPGRSSISNLSRGGRVITSRSLLKSLYKKKSVIDEKNAKIKELCQRVAVALDTECQGIFGELGLDIGIDKNGWPWLIEVNSKPRKTTETEGSQIIMRNSFKRPLEYASYLAGFPVGGGR